jgi:hypothetical protein
LLLATGLLVAITAARADMPATPRVVLTGQKTQSMTRISVNGNTSVTLELIIDKNTTVEVLTTDDEVGERFVAAIKKRLEDQGTRHKELLKLREEAAKNKDMKRVEEIDKECLELLKQMKEGLRLTPAVAEGVLKFVGKKWRLEGTLRPFDAGGKDKGMKLGSCTVGGTAVAGDFKAGETKSGLAIRSGDVTVVVTGPAAAEPIEGDAQVTGTLKLGQSGEATIAASKVEPGKK